MPHVVRWALALAFTQCVEAPVHAAALGCARPPRERWTLALAASLITHPLVWFVVPDVVDLAFPAASPWTAVAVAEGFAVVVEASWLALFGARLALPASVLANGASFTLGLFLYTHLGW